MRYCTRQKCIDPLCFFVYQKKFFACLYSTSVKTKYDAYLWILPHTDIGYPPSRNMTFLHASSIDQWKLDRPAATCYQARARAPLMMMFHHAADDRYLTVTNYL